MQQLNGVRMKKNEKGNVKDRRKWDGSILDAGLGQLRKGKQGKEVTHSISI
jgi:hypothetical protein